MNILHIFPNAGFDRSITTPVLLGVLISWLFTESLGWVFAGLVVPGYLAAVFVLDPRAGMVDVGEAIATYALAKTIGEQLSRTGLTSRVFGRERFLLVVVASVIVRLVVEGLVLPRFAPHAAGSFFSIGLVVVPLAANACWKTGLGRGIVQNGVPTLIVYLILQYILVPHTNISMQGFALATEDVAASFLASPKAYILLITGAILAAAANVLDGWDFHGILVPALLALVVIEPVKFVATFAEAIVLVIVVSLLVRATRLGRWNVEGPRRLVLFFAVDYVLRFSFAWIAGRSMSGLDVVGLMGFGYLLPTLIAVKIAERGSAALVVLPTAQVSIGAFVLGTLIGFCASVVDTGTPPARAAVLRPFAEAPKDPSLAALWTASLSRTEPREPKGQPADARTIVSTVDALLGKDDAQIPSSIAYGAQRLDDGVLLLREKFESVGDRYGDPAVLATKNGRASATRIVAWVSTPSTSPEDAAIAGKLVALGTIDGAVLSGVDDLDRPLDPFVASSLATARALADRGTDDASRGIVLEIRRAARAHVTLGARATHAQRVLDLVDDMAKKLGALDRSEGATHSTNVDVELELPIDALDRLVEAPAAEKIASLSSPEAIASVLDSARISPAAPSPEELLATRRLLLEPLLSANGLGSALPLVVRGAAALGYRVVGPTHLAGGGEGIALLASGTPRPIAIVARTSGVRGSVVELPLASSGDLRDGAIRLGASLHADAYLFGLEPGHGARGGSMLRVAHAIATYPAEERRPELILVRDGGPDWDDAGVVALGAWGGNARDGLVAGLQGALARFGESSTEATIDFPAREIAGRAVLGDVPVVSVLFDLTALRGASLDEGRAAVRALLTTTGVRAIDGEPVDVAEVLAKDLPKTSKAPDDVVSLARRAALEESVVDRRALTDAIHSDAVRAAIARAADGDELVVVAREGKNLLVLAVPTDPRAAHEVAQPKTASSLRACAFALAEGGTCLAESL